MSRQGISGTRHDGRIAGRNVPAAAALAIFAVAGSGPASYAQAVQCETPLVSVETGDPALHGRICTIAASAIPKLGECGLELTYPVTIGFSDNLEVGGHSCVGLYHPGQNRIDLLNPVAFGSAHKETGFWPSVPVSEHFDSIVVHEIAHAMIGQSTDRALSCKVDQEYISYAMQLASLPASTREDFIASTGVEPPVSVEGINQVILDLSPPSFAARAWLHFSDPENGCSFVQKLIRGDSTLFADTE